MKKQVFAKLRQLGLFARAVRLWSREGVDREMNEFIRGERTSYEGCPTFNLEEEVVVEENQEVVVENQEEVVVEKEVVEEKEDRAWWVNRSEVLGLRSRFAPNSPRFSHSHPPSLPITTVPTPSFPLPRSTTTVHSIQHFWQVGSTPSHLPEATKIVSLRSKFTPYSPHFTHSLISLTELLYESLIYSQHSYLLGATAPKPPSSPLL